MTTKTAICAVEWGAGRAELTELRMADGEDDVPAVLEALRFSDWAAIDAPFGWPTEFVKWIRTYADTAKPSDVHPAMWRLRHTDRLVARELRNHPLSVSSDRIGSTARHVAGILARVSEDGRVDRFGDSTRIVEAYPAATLSSFHLAHDRYKGKIGTAWKRRGAILSGLIELTEGRLEIADRDRELLQSSDDMLDALVCAITARVAALALDRKPSDDEEKQFAASEGWIRFPGVDMKVAELFRNRP